MPLPGTVSLNFDPAAVHIGTVDLRTGLSAIALDGDSLWLACDEGSRLERLTRRGDDTFSAHTSVPLSSLLTLPADDSEEADIEGMDVADGWLWVVGSHAVKRKSARPRDKAGAVAEKLATTSRDGNRHLLARLPLAGGQVRRKHGPRRAASIDTRPKSSALLKAIKRGPDGEGDPHLAPFVSVPGKDNGFDIEGLAVNGHRVFVGLRGPVLRGWACVLEVHPVDAGDHLELERVDGRLPYRKHFLNLGGLGIRDLLVLDDDLLILAGPTMTLDGSCAIWRWKKGAVGGPESAVAPLRVLPTRDTADRAEGFTDLPDGVSVLVVYDTPHAERLGDDASVLADVVRL
jgi:hypothetical protein